MRAFGIVLVIAGILMMVFSGVNFQTTKKVADIGPVSIDKKENHHVGWPMYLGGIAMLGGIIVLVAGGKKN